MKKLLFILIAVFLFSCRGEDGPGAKGSAKFNGKVITKEITVGGQLHLNPYQSELAMTSFKGTFPNISYAANPDNSVDIAWHDVSTKKIMITKVDIRGNKLSEAPIQGLPPVGNILGFIKIPDDNSFAIAYSANTLYTNSKDPKEANYLNFEYWMARYDAAGNQIFNRMIFGDGKELKHHLYNPGSSSSGRLAYNEVDKKIGYFVGANKKFGNGSTHQGSTLGAMSLDGKTLSVGKWWHISHDYQQRMQMIGERYYCFGHGDAGPRGLFMSVWHMFQTEKHGKVMRHAPGPDGKRIVTGYERYTSKVRNRTNLQLGDVIKLNNGNFGIVFTRGKDNFTLGDMGYREAYYLQLDPFAKPAAKRKKLTNLGAIKENAGFARIAKKGDNIIIGWHNTNKEKPYAFIGEYDIEGNEVVAPKMIDNTILQVHHGMINLPNGNIFWASNDDKDKTKLFLNWIR